MGKVFISYGDDSFKKSLKRIAKQALSSNRFDSIEIYTPSDLPPSISHSPLMIYQRGGGYWVWKPWIIFNTLKQCKEDDIIYYVDAGCSINPESKEWDEWDSVMRNHDAIVFDYRPNVKYPGWEQYCKNLDNCKPELKHWIKPTAKDYFTQFLGTDNYLNMNQIMSGIIIIRRTHRIPCFIQQWLNIAVLNPSLFFDAYGEELGRLPDTFNEHRHDQAILAPLVFHYKDTDRIAILPEKSESQKEIAAIIATRTHIWSWNLYDRIAWRIKEKLNSITRLLKYLKFYI